MNYEKLITFFGTHHLFIKEMLRYQLTGKEPSLMPTGITAREACEMYLDSRRTIAAIQLELNKELILK